MATEQENVTDQELFDSATAEPTAPESATVETQEPETAEQAEQRARDEKGRFVAKEQTEETQEEAPTEKQEHAIPSWRLKEEAEARREAQQRAERAEREAMEFRQQMAALQAQIQQQNAPKPEPVDMFANPEAWQAQQQQSFESRLRAMEANFSLRLAHNQHGEVFEKAFAEAEMRAHRGDPSIMRQVANSPDPGRTLVDWYQREQVYSQVGNDPNAYKAKLADELLNDDEWLAKAAEKFRAKAGAQPTSQIKLPPSLNKASGSANHGREGDLSDGSLYSYATR